MRRVLVAAAAAIACAGCGTSHHSHRSRSRHPRAGRPHDATASWLGLDYNSRPGVGRLSDFVAHGIVYDREGNIQPPAGALATGDTKLARGLQVSFGAGMVPDLEVDPPATLEAGCPSHVGCVPVGAGAIGTYVRGFVATAQSVLRAYPGRRELFEPMDEPWRFEAAPFGKAQSVPRTAGAYASLLARLLPAIARARNPAIPAADVYVPAAGRLPGASNWLTDLYRAQPCLRPGPTTCGPIAGWNVHPYGRPGRREVGIDSVPGLRTQMASGAGNIVVSEIGFCARDVLGGDACSENASQLDGSSAQTAAWLTQTLRQAAAMHRSGWLKALLVWARLSGGWSMQLPGGTLTAQGQALESFADSLGS